MSADENNRWVRSMQAIGKHGRALRVFVGVLAILMALTHGAILNVDEDVAKWFSIPVSVVSSLNCSLFGRRLNERKLWSSRNQS